MALRPRQRCRGSYRLVTAVVAAMGLIAVLVRWAGQEGPPTPAVNACHMRALTGEGGHVRDGATIVIAGVHVRLAASRRPR